MGAPIWSRRSHLRHRRASFKAMDSSKTRVQRTNSIPATFPLATTRVGPQEGWITPPSSQTCSISDWKAGISARDSRQAI